jgi:DNA-binding MarR family transcriptional regulator
MSSRLPKTTARERPENLAILLREAFRTLNDAAVARVVEQHPALRGAHGVVFQYLDDAGTTVTVLAERAQMTKQSMGELVRHLEDHGYVERTPDPRDGRAKLVRATQRGREVYVITREFALQTERHLREVLGAERWSQLREDLETIRSSAGVAHPGGDSGDRGQ